MTTRPAPNMVQTTIDLGDRIAPLTARVNRRARRLIITVDSVAGRVIVTAPSKRAISEAIDFARTSSKWIKSRLSETSGPKPFEHGVTFPLRGRPTTIVQSGSARNAVRQDGEMLIVGGDGEHVNRRVTDWLKKEARAALTVRVDHHSDAINCKRGSISIRDTRSRWGSCAADGSMSFSWRLILAPSEILDYVAAHECAHLVHLNHSPAFWRLLREMGVDARAARDWFAAYGSNLYAFGAKAA